MNHSSTACADTYEAKTTRNQKRDTFPNIQACLPLHNSAKRCFPCTISLLRNTRQSSDRCNPSPTAKTSIAAIVTGKIHPTMSYKHNLLCAHEQYTEVTGTYYVQRRVLQHSKSMIHFSRSKCRPGIPDPDYRPRNPTSLVSS